MADVLVQGGQAYLRHPQTGMVVPVPEGELADAMAAGFEPTTPQEFAQKRTQEHFGTTGGAAKAALAGAARGASLGLSDVLLQGAVDPETLAGLRQANPFASAAGETAGAVGSMFLPVSPLAQVGRAGAALGEGATAAAARLLGTSASRAAPRLAGALSREGFVGAAFGAGQGISDVALDPGALTPGEQAARILSQAGKGAAIGAGIGSLSWLGQTGIARIRDRYTLGMAEIKALRGEKAALEAEQATLQASGASAEQAARLQAQLSGVAQELHERQVGAIGKLFTRAAAYGIGHAIGGGVTGGLVGVLVAPKMLRAFAGALEPLGVKAGNLASRAWSASEPYFGSAWAAVREPAEAAWTKVAPFVERAAQTPLGEAAVDTAKSVAASQASRALSGLAEKVPGGAAVAEKIGGVVASIPDAVASGAMIGGLPGAAAGYAIHRFTMPIGRAVEVLTKKVAPAGRLALVDSLTSDDWRRAAEELANVQPSQIDLAVKMGLPESTPPEAKEAVSQRLQAAVGYLQTLQPQKAYDQVPIAAVAAASKEGAKQGFEQAMKAIVQPATLVQSFVDQTLTREQVKAWEAVYPEALAQVRAMVDSGVASGRARGGHFSRKRAEQISILKGSHDAAPRLAQPAMVGRIQAMHQAGRTQRQGPRSSGRPLNLAKNMTTPMQRIGRGGF